MPSAERSAVIVFPSKHGLAFKPKASQKNSRNPLVVMYFPQQVTEWEK
jgi:hypothetical protein